MGFADLWPCSAICSPAAYLELYDQNQNSAVFRQCQKFYDLGLGCCPILLEQHIMQFEPLKSQAIHCDTTLELGGAHTMWHERWPKNTQCEAVISLYPSASGWVHLQ